jgi:hypothetical protein
LLIAATHNAICARPGSIRAAVCSQLRAQARRQGGIWQAPSYSRRRARKNSGVPGALFAFHRKRYYRDLLDKLEHFEEYKKEVIKKMG